MASPNTSTNGNVPHGVFDGEWHEHDPRWTAVDGYTMFHLNPETSPTRTMVHKALARSRAEGLPDIATQPTLGKTLALQCRAGHVKHVLEVGTLGGSTPIWIAGLNPDIKIDTIEVDPHHAEVAKRNIEIAGLSERVNVTVGSALEVLERWVDEVQHGTRQPFGLTYIDADKENNWNYFDLAVKASSPGATIYVDNIVQMGELVKEFKDGEEADEGVTGARELVERVGKDPRVEAVVQQTVSEKSYDGYLMAVVL